MSPAFAVMVAVPALTAVTTPSLTVATVSSEEVHVTVLSVALSGVTVALRVVVSPTVSAAVVLSRVTFSTATTLAFTVTVQVAVCSPTVTVMVAVPSPTNVTVPAFTVATFSAEDFHVTASVHAFVVSSAVMVGVSFALSPTVPESSALSRTTLTAGLTTSVISTSQGALNSVPFTVAVMVVLLPAEPETGFTRPFSTDATVGSATSQMISPSAKSAGSIVGVSCTPSVFVMRIERVSWLSFMPVTL